MSYFHYNVKCDKCGRETVTAFGIVGTTQVAEPIEDCECGGKFKSTEVFKKASHK